MDEAGNAARFEWEALIQATGGFVSGSGRQPFAPARITTDTRSLAAGDFYLPLTGERFNGHDFLPQAYERGASGAFAAERERAGHPEWAQFPNLISVVDPLQAYLALGRFHRRRMNARVVALTGSSGKTTTKEMMHAAFCAVAPTQCTPKNFNNEVGVSQTLLSLQSETRLLVVEMGMRGPGEIGLLSRHAEPDVAVVLNVGPAHIGRLGSLEAIARAKCEIFEGLNPEAGVAVVNAEDALLLDTAKRFWTGRLETFRLADADPIETTADGRTTFTYRRQPVVLPLPGVHMVANALAVLKTGEILGFDTTGMVAGLARFEPSEGRWRREPLDGFENVWVVNDAYNANPASMKASLEAFLGLPVGQDPRRILLLGGMKELGQDARFYHEELGRWLGLQPGIAALLTLGGEGAWIAESARASAGYPVVHLGASEADPAQTAQTLLQTLAGEGLPLRDAVLFLKGSRACRLETLPEQLQRMAPPSPRALNF